MKTFKLLFLPLYVATLFSCSVSKVTSQQKSSENPVQEVLDNYKDSIADYGVVVLLKQNNEVLTGAVGVSHLGVAITKNHVFNIGSLTKMFTAVLVLQEVEKGNLSLNDTIGSFFYGNPNVDSTITIEQLLRHQSGLGEVGTAELSNETFANILHELNYANLYYKIPEKQFDKGTKTSYCNSNYTLLGYILEALNNKPYDKILEERIFTPLKMTNTYPYLYPDIPNLAHPMYGGEDLLPYMNFRFYKNFCFSDGSIGSTLDDLLIFLENLYVLKKLISDESLKMMTTFNEQGYGMGNFENKLGSEIYWGHGGDNISYTVRDYFNPKTNTILIIMGNHFTFKYRKEITNQIIEKVIKN